MNQFLYDVAVMLTALLPVAALILLAFKRKWIEISNNVNYDEINKYIEDKTAEEVKKHITI